MDGKFAQNVVTFLLFVYLYERHSSGPHHCSVDKQGRLTGKRIFKLPKRRLLAAHHRNSILYDLMRTWAQSEEKKNNTV